CRLQKRRPRFGRLFSLPRLFSYFFASCCPLPLKSLAASPTQEECPCTPHCKSSPPNSSVPLLWYFLRRLPYATTRSCTPLPKLVCSPSQSLTASPSGFPSAPSDMSLVAISIPRSPSASGLRSAFRPSRPSPTGPRNSSAPSPRRFF